MLRLALALGLLAAPASAGGIEILVAGEDGEKGKIVIDLFEDIAPNHAARITELAEAGSYDNVVFHRVIDGFMAQTGDVKFGDMSDDAFSMRQAGMGGSDGDDLKAEFSDTPYVKGIVGMARSRDPNSANSQFFIMFAPAGHLDGQYTVVGKVTEGLDVVDSIKLGEGRNGEVLGEPDRMVSVTVVSDAVEMDAKDDAEDPLATDVKNDPDAPVMDKKDDASDK